MSGLQGPVLAAAEVERSLTSVQTGAVSDAPQPPSATAAFQPPPLPAASAAQEEKPLASSVAPAQPSEAPQASEPAASTTDEGAESWLSRLGGPTISMIVIGIAAGPACGLSIYRRMQEEEEGEGRGGLLGWSCRRSTWKSDEGSESDSDSKS
eukprot:TRINITY_DN5593_c0_g2_i4.p2 TRINITY_DN5593_c0_g2~~TRINITY_DN5593_c0_g2_i4.p2  ORF type:complete len:153 (-),score=43.09 TRINITY_DN5593_c0_g2_i4:101-559(-)